MDRRRRQPRTGTFTVGCIILMMGLYAFGDRETVFTNALARMRIEEFWGVAMVVAGLAHVWSGLWPSCLNVWAANWLAIIVCGWTYTLFTLKNISTPTINACGVIALCAMGTMAYNAHRNAKTRSEMRGLSSD